MTAHSSLRPWRTSFPQAARWDDPIEIGTLPDLIGGSVRDWPDRPAITFRGATMSYRVLGGLIDRLAAGFLRIGVSRGATVALYLPNTPWHPISFFALTKIGARVAHISALDAPREITHKLSDSGAIVMITTNLPGLLPQAQALLADRPNLRLLVGDDARWGGAGATAPFEISERVQPLDALLAEDAPPAFPPVAPDDIALLQYTGGTTGLPKAAMLSHGNLTASVAMYRSWDDGDRREPATGRCICVLPLFHIYALTTVMLRCMRDADELLLHQRFDAETVITEIENRRATMIAGVPTIWIALANHPGVQARDFSSLRICACGGAPMPFEMEQRVEAITRKRMRIGWGMTETAPAGTRVPAAAAPRPGLIGIPFPHLDMRIVSRDDPAKTMPPDESGEIAVRGPNVFKGYWNQPEETKAAFVDGWFLTGDIGAMDAQGVFRILDRKKNMIISSGYNVYPTAIENALYEHPSVREAIVIGVADPYRGQSAKAFVSLHEGAPRLTLDAMRDFLSSRLGRHEIPTALEIRSELPRSPAGKLLAKVLIEEERAKSAQPPSAASS